ncbi:FERRIC REDUCTION OXIDASE 2, ferric reduction oxidase 2, FERRIC CHELATE REDUCTASE DEFECTIVE 1 [Hibiscus trionum]|uniref:ferric-chelate reductase (NADH) n=2 Tax=Hibiscus trionum TaxID=183268 RepID=A0A9W7GZD3_HIBTR|nr:FERRIC REDUCTION OXIDASE 2, ferric reduction oxidase 2, FERRIC CHELATE REDUCTASE DEFECTIVE 1 [Hibiscus trionum]
MDSKFVRAIIRHLLTVIFLGICMMWIMAPTDTYKQKWKPAISKKVVSTYFGTQAPNMLVWTFPVLFVAAMGSFYLHLGKKNSNQNDSQSDGRIRWPALWRRPVLVKGPLGIVSGLELAMFVMFIALLAWTLGTYLHRLPTLTAKVAAADGVQVWQLKLAKSALWIGLTGNVCLAFLFYPVARGSSVLPVLGLTSEGSIKYHIWLGHLTMVLFTAHGVCFIVFWAATGQISEMLKWSYSDISNVAGEISLLGGLALWAATFPRIRRNFFELFFYTHHLYIIFVFFFLLHVGIGYAFVMLPGFYLFVIDRYLRFLQSRTSVRLLSARVLPCNVVELNFAKSHGLTYNPTSIVFVNVPNISKLQWHPFTVSSNSNLEADKLSVIIKCEGSWTTKLDRMLSSSIERLDVAIEGPYGPASNHFLRHDTIVMVSGGSGITPFISVIRELIFRSKLSECKTPDIILISIFKSSLDLTMLDLLLPMTGSPSELSNLKLRIEAYVTKEKEPATDNSKRVRSVWFKPLPTDKPMAAILGPNSWLWLGAIISSSFIMFLILIGIITRFYIYPKDHNKNKFSTSKRAVLNILAIFVSIAATASAAVFWNKRRYAREAMQVQNMEGQTPEGSPNTMAYNGDRELESLPNQSLAEATKIHYGGRPDLKRLIFECKGESIGVLASGPTKLRHDVAAICSSGLADNLHFESISFSW